MPIAAKTIDNVLASKQGQRAYRIVETLSTKGYDTWWVGGAVRDMLGGKIPKDIDIATRAHPKEIHALFTRASGGDESFGSARVMLGEEEFEVTTFREDDEASDGRHPEAVVFGDRQADAKRRDFTVNAIYFQPINREIFDPFHGEADWKEKLVRFIGQPAIRIKHDALRILRAVRLRASIDGQYEPETYIALKESAELIDTLSGERKLSEFEKMLKTQKPARALEDLFELGLMERMIPELSACKGIPQPAEYHHEGDVWDHMLKLSNSFTEEHGADVRLAGVFHDCGKAITFNLKERIRFDEHATKSAELAAQALKRLMVPRKRIEKIDWLIRHHMMMSAFFELNEERKAHWYFHPWFEELLQIFWLDIAGTEPSNFSLYDRIVADRNAFLDSHPRPEKVLLTGDEIMKILGIKPGALVGEMMQKLHDAQTRKEVTTKAEAKAFLEKIK